MALPPARQDGRPLYFDAGGHSACAMCERMGVTMVYPPGQHALSDRANSPFGPEDTGVYVVCMGHIPDNAVIYSPLTGECRNKAGTKTWREDEPVVKAIRLGDRVLVHGFSKDNETGAVEPVVRKGTVTSVGFGNYGVTFDNGEQLAVEPENISKINPREGLN